MTKMHIVSAELYATLVSAALKRHLDDGSILTREKFAQASGQDLRTIKSHCCGESGPRGHDLLTYFSLLPVDFAAEILGHIGLTVERDNGEVIPAVVLSDIAQGVAELAGALADGRIDHTERPQLIRDLSKAAHEAHALALQLMALEG